MQANGKRLRSPAPKGLRAVQDRELPKAPDFFSNMLRDMREGKDDETYICIGYATRSDVVADLRKDFAGMSGPLLRAVALQLKVFGQYTKQRVEALCPEDDPECLKLIGAILTDNRGSRDWLNKEQLCNILYGLQHAVLEAKEVLETHANEDIDQAIELLNAVESPAQVIVVEQEPKLVHALEPVREQPFVAAVSSDPDQFVQMQQKEPLKTREVVQNLQPSSIAEIERSATPEARRVLRAVRNMAPLPVAFRSNPLHPLQRAAQAPLGDTPLTFTAQAPQANPFRFGAANTSPQQAPFQFAARPSNPFAAANSWQYQQSQQSDSSSPFQFCQK